MKPAREPASSHPKHCASLKKILVTFLALCLHDAKHDPVVYGAEFGVVFLAKDPRTASIQDGPDCLGLYHSGL